MKPSNSSSLHIQPDKIMLPPRFPFSISSSRGVSPSFQRLHWHRALEINWISGGSGIYVINGKEYHFEQGDLFLIDSQDLHRAYEGKNLEMVIVMFEPALLGAEQRYDHDILMPFRHTGTEFPNRISHNHPSAALLGGYVKDMLREFESGQPSYISAIRGLLLLFLTEINRRFRAEQSDSGRVSAKHLEQIREVIQKMDSSLAQPWTLNQLAGLVHLSPSRFSALFSQIAGTSPMNYLVQLRLEYAVSLLEQEGLSILEIAEASGFRNLSNFNRLFLHHVGISPSALRRRLLGGNEGESHKTVK
ncbi:helix-turn-helix domain-containing protein [Fontibacillus sp. BL9]|uniref:AraC family transcriptional regulator n=1 Tax=Fontibacillus sp. BL9 TaxID=3389971 RepID=UPI00397B116D